MTITIAVRDPDGTCEESRHADKSKRRRMYAPRRRQNSSEEESGSRAKRRAADESRGENAARTARTDGKRGRYDVQEEHRKEHDCISVLDEAAANDRIASAVYAWENEVAEKTDDETADDDLHRTGNVKIRKRLLCASEETYVESRAEGYYKREREIGEKSQRIFVRAWRHGEKRLPPEEIGIYRVGNRRGDEARQNRLVFDVARRIEDLEPEDRARERCLEKRHDAGSETCRH